MKEIHILDLFTREEVDFISDGLGRLYMQLYDDREWEKADKVEQLSHDIYESLHKHKRASTS